MDTSNTLNDRVSASTPTFGGLRPEQFIGEGEHQEGPATGWFGAITVQGAREVSPFAFYEVVVICSPIGWQEFGIVAARYEKVGPPTALLPPMTWRTP